MIKGSNVLVVGSGMSGIGAVSLLYRMGAKPVLFDENASLTIEEVKKKLPLGVEVRIVLGTLPKEIEDAIQILLLSPGVPCDTPFVEGFRARHIPVWGEIELAFRAEKGKLAAITGTNGKTTTTSLVGEILKEYYRQVFIVGNIGTPYTQEVVHTNEESVTAAEISSFQLETIESFRPAVSAILNVTPDHLNRHHTMENYAAVKEAIAKNQGAEDICVLNYDNPYTRSFGKRCPARVVWFSSAEEPEEGLFLEKDWIWQKNGKERIPLLNICRDMNLVGMCNVENVMAAIAITLGMGVPMEAVLEGIRKFKAVEHRIEYVATRAEVDYYNDSKGTNPDAAIQGIKAMSKPTLLIGGGYDKGSEFDEWIEAFDGKVKLLVLLGQTKEKIAECARRHGFDKFVFADTFEEAFEICKSNACPGDAVLLSPACASWGMFPNYEVRGKLFKKLVNGIKE